MTRTRLDMLRVTAAPLLLLAVLVSIASHRAGAAVRSARGGMINRLGANAPLHRMSNGKIAFFGGFADGSVDEINPDGSGLRRLVRCKTPGCLIVDAVWSPDGRRVAFLRGMPTRGGDMPLSDLSLYVKNADGSGERWLAGCGKPVGCLGTLAWSPNGAALALSRNLSLYVFDLTTGRLRRLTAGGLRRLTEPRIWGRARLFEVAPIDLGPAWSPDGSRIAFARALHGCVAGCPTEPFIVNADGTGLKRLSSRLGPAVPPLWSPDGRTIALSANGISTVDPDGSHLRPLVRAPPNRANRQQTVAGWSPDGKHILYVSDPFLMGPTGPQATALWVMNANGTGRRRLYRAGHGYIGDATWSPDGQRIAFSIEVDRGDGKVNASRSGLFVMSADGRHLQRLAAGGWEPVCSWQPIR